MNLGRWVTVAEVLALAAIAYGLYYGWEKLAALWNSSPLAHPLAALDAAVAAQTDTYSATDANGNPTGNLPPVADPTNTAEIIDNQAQAGVTRPNWGEGEWD